MNSSCLVNKMISQITFLPITLKLWLATKFKLSTLFSALKQITF